MEGNNYCFIFEGHKNGDKEIEEDKKNEVSKLICKKNFRKSNNFKLKIPIPFQLITKREKTKRRRNIIKN